MADDDKGAARAMNKRDCFTNEPMGKKTVKKIPGIGPVIGGSLNEGGITYARQVFGKFLLGNGDAEHFQKFLKGHGANSGQRRSALEALESYDKNYNH